MMDYCATHNHFYNEYCVYCGNPYKMTTASGTGGIHVHEGNEDEYHDADCKPYVPFLQFHEQKKKAKKPHKKKQPN